jgi:hypothetical protein
MDFGVKLCMFHFTVSSINFVKKCTFIFLFDGNER